MVFNRLCAPDSKLGCLRWLETVAVPAIPESITLQYLLRAMDALKEHLVVVEGAFAKQVRPQVDYALTVAIYVWKTCNGIPQRGAIGDQVGPALICCRNSFSSSNDGTANRVDLRREDRVGSAAAPPNCPSVPQWVRIES